MPQHVEKLAVMFADICGSTALYEELGDDLARQLISGCLATINKSISSHQGTLIKTIGDEAMCTFPSAEIALNAACVMQQAIRNEQPASGKPLHIRVGFHYGDTILESGDVFGDTVNIAARVASITRAGQIMTTQTTVEALPPALKEKTRHVMRTDLKGKLEQFDIYLVVWEQDDMMSTRIIAPTFRSAPNINDELTLSFHERSYTVNKGHRSIMMGRGDTCDIVVPNNLASRQHVRIEWRSGKLVIIDQSSNGTYLRFSDGKVVQITREEMILHGKGSISLGHSFADNPTELVEFSIAPPPS
jgi:adenylate cyclase